MAGPDQIGWASLPPPPPEVPSRGSLVWRAAPAGRPTRPLPSHPLLMLAEPPDTAAPRPLGLKALWSAWRRPVRDQLSWATRSASAIPALAGRRSEGLQQVGRRSSGLVVLVVGGKGGTGRSTLAANLAYAFSRGQDSRRVLLVDADPEDPDLDLRLGARRSGRDLFPLARLDQLVLRLADLRERGSSLDGCLFTAPDLGFHCLLAPADDQRSATVGREHLDYLFEHILRPQFQVIVVDGGGCLSGNAVSLRFWLEKASFALIPTALGESHQRNCVRTVSYLEHNSSLDRGDCLAVAALDSDLRELRRQLSQEGIEVVAVPWNPKAARLADARQVPSAHVDQGMRSASLALADQLSRIATGGAARGL